MDQTRKKNVRGDMHTIDRKVRLTLVVHFAMMWLAKSNNDVSKS